MIRGGLISMFAVHRTARCCHVLGTRRRHLLWGNRDEPRMKESPNWFWRQGTTDEFLPEQKNQNFAASRLTAQHGTWETKPRRRCCIERRIVIVSEEEREDIGLRVRIITMSAFENVGLRMISKFLLENSTNVIFFDIFLDAKWWILYVTQKIKMPR